MNELKRLAEFEELLQNYSVSDYARRILQKTDLLLMAGVSSSGRNTIVNHLIQNGKYHFIVSDTTRKPRINHGVIEVDGKEYWFKTEEQFLKGLRAGKYLEFAIIHGQQVSGISIAEIEKAHNEKRIAATDIEIKGVESIVKAKPDAICLFVIPPNFTVWLERMNGRGVMPDSEIQRRLESAVKEIQRALQEKYYTIIVNDDFHETAGVVDNIKNIKPAQAKPRTIAQQLLSDTQTYLASKKSN